MSGVEHWARNLKLARSSLNWHEQFANLQFAQTNSGCYNWTNKKLSCRTETARRFV